MYKMHVQDVGKQLFLFREFKGDLAMPIALYVSRS